MGRRDRKFQCIACRVTCEEYADFCEICKKEDTIVERDFDSEVEEGEGARPRGRARLLTDVSPSLPPKTSTGRPAWDIALGGGLTRPSSVLVQGPKGVGKSTSALRIADFVSQRHRKPALYGSAEMPKEHVRNLANLLGLKMSELYIQDSGHLEDMVSDIEELKPILVIWDSIQRFQVDGEFGDIPLRETVTGAIRSGNAVKAISILLSQVTKEDEFIGRSGIGHDVDAILSLRRREEKNEIWVECLEKNRFAPTPLSAHERLYEEGGVRTHASQGSRDAPPRAPSEKR